VKTDERATRDDPEPSAKPPEKKRRNPFLRFLGELPGLILMAFILALIIKTFLVQAFFIPSPSMEPTLVEGDRVLVSQVPYYFHDPNRGDVIVFEDPDPKSVEDRGLVGGAVHWVFQGLGVQKPDNEDFIKRVIGIPGDTVWAKDGQVYVNGDPISEPYLVDKTANFPHTDVPDGKLFVMGDNRSNSLDSRFGLGFIPIDDVIGEAFFVVWPPANMVTL
jgi:signal peptidase I